ncbi:lycopene cyclase domain-containing protein [Nocardioides sp. REDSEA-S30_B4]|jgi:lycopene cyclase domain-containing protein|uniref:lycopene cyclase domain-containing protein n=1 Tax=Nocardioides sp. REDSEA-S30_B4 TaxID=1811552 RepID=UPI000AE994B6|nr:lycopene cyclase domain-containing protein [Nocardioides sp. REDSEA-S30_B4]MAY96083.1 lycopene cyclase [Nocardioides sp.]MCK5927728.1 lycopene cyclase domain-containing protein [Nocardioides sp.]|tara:strand:+ start:218 stop:637 length:420 start_codon:yes stop_codon:yes gene_type:complete
MERGEYLVVMGLCLLITLPLELLLGARVWRRPRRLLVAMAPLVLAYSIWDIAMIAAGSWSYSEEKLTGILLPFEMPLEELVFFIVVPICGLLTLEAVGNVLTALGRLRAGEPLGRVLRDLPHGGGPRPAPSASTEEKVA